MPLFKKREQEPEEEKKPVPMATAKNELYALGNLIRVGDQIPIDSPIFMNTQWAFDFDPQEVREYHGL